MNRNQGVIHLGRSKSPEITRKAFNQVVIPQSGEVTTILRKRSPVHQNPLASTMYAGSISDKLEDSQELFAKTHQGAFKVSREKQNDLGMSADAQSKLAGLGRGCKKSLTKQNSVLSHAHTNSVSQSNKPLVSEKQMQMGRKILLLESRVQQLHKEKQACIIKAHEQNKRLVIQNSHIKGLLAQYESIKNQFMINQVQLSVLNSPNRSPKVNFVPIQYSALEQQDEDDKTSITFDIDQRNNLVSKTKLVNQKDSQIESLKSQLRSTQAKIVEIIQLKQQNGKMKQLIKKLQDKNTQHLAKIQELKITVTNDSITLKNTNQFLGLSLEQSECYVSKLLAAKQQIMSKDNQIKLHKAEQIQIEKQLGSKIKELEQNLKTTIQKSMQGCKKCSNLMKALVKMNQRVYVTGPVK